MLTPPDISADVIASHVQSAWGVDVAQVAFLPIGADVDSAVFRLASACGTAYFLKLRRARFDEIAVAVPAFLHKNAAPAVMAPLPATGGALWASGQGFAWILYPYFDGPNGFTRPLSDEQWVTLGQSLRAVHSAILPATLAARIPREDYSPRWRDRVTAYSEQVERERFADPIAAQLAVGWRTKQHEIATLVERAADLGRILRERALPFVLCHTDLHAGNVLLGAHNELAIVDWDDPLYAPRERDLMFIGGGIGGIWGTPREEARFYQGYGPVDIDLTAVAYYRYERIVADFAAYGEQIFEAQGSIEDRENGVRKVMGQFEPGRVIEIAHRTYQRLA